jgi:hypothetical protein
MADGWQALITGCCMDFIDVLGTCVVGIVLVGFVVYLSLQMLSNILALQWLRVPGEVVYTEITVNRDDDFQKIYSASIEYRYQVKGVEYFSSRYAFGYSGSRMQFLAKRLIKKYPPQSLVQVRVNPQKPSEAVLVAGLIGSHFGTLIFIVLLIAMVLGGLARLVG